MANRQAEAVPLRGGGARASATVAKGDLVGIDAIVGIVGRTLPLRVQRGAREDRGALTEQTQRPPRRIAQEVHQKMHPMHRNRTERWSNVQGHSRTSASSEQPSRGNRAGRNP